MQITSEEGFFRASIRVVPSKSEPSPALQQASERVTGLFEQYVKLSQSLNYDTMIAAVRVEDPGKLSDAISANLQIPVEEKQELLELFEPLERLNRIADILEVEIEKLNVDRIHQHARQAPDGTRPERVLPQRKAQGHPEGTRAAAKPTKSSSSRRRSKPPACLKARRKRPCRNSSGSK